MAPAKVDDEAVNEEKTDAVKGAVSENDDAKLFVGNVSWDTTEEQLKEYFEKFGVVKKAIIKLNELGQSKGFGFILFEEASAIEKVDAQADHTLKGRKLNAKKATPREKIKKIFVGGLSPKLPEEDIRTHFEQYGEIESMELPMNKEKDPPIRKGFCFITFKEASSCDAATAKGKLKQNLGDRFVEVRKAIPQQDAGRGGGRGGPRGGRGGRGGGFAPPAYGAYADPYAMYDPYGYYGYGDPYAMMYASYGYPQLPAAGGGKMRGGRGRGRGRPY